jgi:hypothetical protein
MVGLQGLGALLQVPFGNSAPGEPHHHGFLLEDLSSTSPSRGRRNGIANVASNPARATTRYDVVLPGSTRMLAMGRAGCF